MSQIEHSIIVVGIELSHSAALEIAASRFCHLPNAVTADSLLASAEAALAAGSVVARALQKDSFCFTLLLPRTTR